MQARVIKQIVDQFEKLSQVGRRAFVGEKRDEVVDNYKRRLQGVFLEVIGESAKSVAQLAEVGMGIAQRRKSLQLPVRERVVEREIVGGNADRVEQYYLAVVGDVLSDYPLDERQMGHHRVEYGERKLAATAKGMAIDSQLGVGWSGFVVEKGVGEDVG